MNSAGTRLAIAALLLAWAPPSAWGASSGGSGNVEVRLVAERASIRPGEPFRVGLRMRLKDGWHTYWKHAGDAGMPLRVAWALPAGFTAGPIEWPAPERIPTGGLVSYGYEREVLLAAAITPPARVAAESVTIAGTFDWLECKDVCLAGSARLALALPVLPDPPEPGPAARLFAETRERLPRPAEGWLLAAAAGPRAIELSFRAPPGAAPRGAHFFSDQPLVVEHAAPQGFERRGDRARLTALPAKNAGGLPRRLTGVLVLEGVPWSRGKALAVDVAAAPGDPAPAPPARTRARRPGFPYAILMGLAVIALVLVARRRARSFPTSGERP